MSSLSKVNTKNRSVTPQFPGVPLTTCQPVEFMSQVVLHPVLKILVSTDISILEFYGYIGYIGDISMDIFT